VQQLGAWSPEDAASLQGRLAEEQTWAMRAAPIDMAAVDLLANSAQPMQEQLRGILNVESGSRPERSGPLARAPRSTHPVSDNFDFGISSSDWAREAMQTLLDMTVQSHVNERGQQSFSLFGLGSFTLTVSSDRSEISLSEDDHAWLTLRRTSTTGAGRDSSGGELFGEAAGGPHGGPQIGLPPLRQAIEYVTEVASHPLSLLVYCIVAVYVLLWSLLARQPKRQERLGRPLRSAGMEQATRREGTAIARQRRSDRKLAAVEAGSSGTSESDPSKRRRRRKRVRIRIRRSRMRHSAET
jgi:hypothetical protein